LGFPTTFVFTYRRFYLYSYVIFDSDNLKYLLLCFLIKADLKKMMEMVSHMKTQPPIKKPSERISIKTASFNLKK
jgi:hypothetical protein